jgi:DNA-binding SARP family transcriptional activator
MRFRVLGSLGVWDGRAWLPVRAAQQRTVLAVLLVSAGRVVTTERLVDELRCAGRTGCGTASPTASST